MKFVLSTIALLSLSTPIFAQEQTLLEEWKGFSDPDIFNSGFTHELTALPLEGSIEVGPKAWSGDYWASKKGSINIRWNTPNRVGWDYHSPSKDEVINMSTEQMAALSPSEKMDLLAGRYDYPFKAEVKGNSSKRAKDWAGICNGWAPASLFHNEPTPKVITNPDGINIPFGSGDIKALISYFYAMYHESDYQQMGQRCYFGSWLGGLKGCSNDLNAGAFHIVLANKIGLQKEGFVMDRDRYNEVWNQPVVGYKTEVLRDNLRPSNSAAKNTVKEMRVKTEVIYVNESDPTWDLVMGTDEQKIAKLELEYRLEINSEGKVIGGEWESSQRPDFIWNKTKAIPTDYTGLLSDLPKLLND